MIRPVFHTTFSNLNTEERSERLLLMEVNETAVSYVIADAEKQLVAAAYFVYPQTEGRNLGDVLREIIYGQEMLQQDFTQSVVVYNFSESTLVPEALYNNEINRDSIELLFGNLKKGLILQEKINGLDAHTLYRVPANIHSLMQQKFTTGKYWHMYTLWLEALKKFPSGQEEDMYIVFGSDKMLVAVFKEQQLQLIRSFPYATPEDVVYHLLHCSDQLSLSQEKCLLHISGYIDEDSVLFNEIKKYFLRLEFDKLNQAAEAIEGEYPSHYFSYLQKMAVCV